MNTNQRSHRNAKRIRELKYGSLPLFADRLARQFLGEQD